MREFSIKQGVRHSVKSHTSFLEITKSIHLKFCKLGYLSRNWNLLTASLLIGWKSHAFFIDFHDFKSPWSEIMKSSSVKIDFKNLIHYFEKCWIPRYNKSSYIFLIRLQFMYCSVLWKPYLVKHIQLIALWCIKSGIEGAIHAMNDLYS